jgi:hypothetical protein
MTTQKPQPKERKEGANGRIIHPIALKKVAIGTACSDAHRTHQTSEQRQRAHNRFKITACTPSSSMTKEDCSSTAQKADSRPQSSVGQYDTKGLSGVHQR